MSTHIYTIRMEIRLKLRHMVVVNVNQCSKHSDALDEKCDLKTKTLALKLNILGSKTPKSTLESKSGAINNTDFFHGENYNIFP